MPSENAVYIVKCHFPAETITNPGKKVLLLINSIEAIVIILTVNCVLIF